jgi:hypothetical protein
VQSCRKFIDGREVAHQRLLASWSMITAPRITMSMATP